MGLRYIAFRISYELKKRTGILEKSYPTNYTEEQFISLLNWRETAPKFFFDSKKSLNKFDLSADGKQKLKEEYQLIKDGKFKFFSSTIYDLGVDYDWVTNPDTGYKYDSSLHWTKIPDLDPEKGDIKYVWEKSRFSFLYTIIRYDKHFETDESEFVLNQISDWIDKNPLNCGPNYVCSQETSLRVLNWTFALYYYKDSDNLTEDAFQKIMNSIYWQIKHVETNINFSRIAVRNNHAITETMMLFLGGILFPFYPEALVWKEKGQKYFEEEVLYQVYEDGSYIQYSMNYQRVVVQLFTWALNITTNNNINIDNEVCNRISKCLNFLYQLQDDETGELPNYGANDGALFFPLNSSEYRNYKPQLNALSYYASKKSLYSNGDWNEDLFWYYGIETIEKQAIERHSSEFRETGYYSLRGDDKFSFIRCGNHKDRPSQADNLHFDLWVDGINLLRDSGSYKYNSTPEDIKYFMGTASHNTVQLGDFDQMQKGGRFIWYNWSEVNYARIEDDESWLIFEGEISAYKHINSKIRHKRIVKQHKQKQFWEIEDFIENNNLEATQIWNINPQFKELGYSINSFDKEGNEIKPNSKAGFYSSFYGVKEESEQMLFKTKGNYFKTVIEKK